MLYHQLKKVIRFSNLSSVSFWYFKCFIFVDKSKFWLLNSNKALKWREKIKGNKFDPRFIEKYSYQAQSAILQFFVEDWWYWQNLWWFVLVCDNDNNKNNSEYETLFFRTIHTIRHLENDPFSYKRMSFKTISKIKKSESNLFERIKVYTSWTVS